MEKNKGSSTIKGAETHVSVHSSHHTPPKRLFGRFLFMGLLYGIFGKSTLSWHWSCNQVSEERDFCWHLNTGNTTKGDTPTAMLSLLNGFKRSLLPLRVNNHCFTKMLQRHPTAGSTEKSKLRSCVLWLLRQESA